MARAAGVVVLVVVALLIGQWAASESGEVVVITSLAASGERAETRLWVVDLEGHAWLRGSADSGWFQRVRAQPVITVQRGDVTGTWLAVPEAARRDEVNALMRAKYGWADAFIELMISREDAIALRLEAVAPE